MDKEDHNNDHYLCAHICSQKLSQNKKKSLKTMLQHEAHRIFIITEEQSQQRVL